jgi:hypothetical protein
MAPSTCSGTNSTSGRASARGLERDRAIARKTLQGIGTAGQLDHRLRRSPFARGEGRAMLEAHEKQNAWPHARRYPREGALDAAPQCPHQ